MAQQRTSTDQIGDYDVQSAANYQCFWTDLTPYTQAQEIESNCGDIAFYNKGTSIMVINNIQYVPGDGLSVDCKAGEMNVTRYRLRFINTGSQLDYCFIMRKIFVVKQ
jgi:hypothetical protein